jgi:hypothetical protein
MVRRWKKFNDFVFSIPYIDMIYIQVCNTNKRIYLCVYICVYMKPLLFLIFVYMFWSYFVILHGLRFIVKSTS